MTRYLKPDGDKIPVTNANREGIVHSLMNIASEITVQNFISVPPYLHMFVDSINYEIVAFPVK